MKILFNIIFLGIFIASCSTSTTKEVNKEKESVTEINSRSEMISKTREILEDSPNLSETQKNKFLTLHEQTIDKIENYNAEIRKLKIVLFQSMTAENYSPRKIKEVTKQLRKAYNKRLDTMFDSMSSAKEILGRNIPQKLYLYDWRIK